MAWDLEKSHNNYIVDHQHYGNENWRVRAMSIIISMTGTMNKVRTWRKSWWDWWNGAGKSDSSPSVSPWRSVGTDCVSMTIWKTYRIQFPNGRHLMPAKTLAFALLRLRTRSLIKKDLLCSVVRSLLTTKKISFELNIWDGGGLTSGNLGCLNIDCFRFEGLILNTKFKLYAFRVLVNQLDFTALSLTPSCKNWRFTYKYLACLNITSVLKYEIYVKISWFKLAWPYMRSRQLTVGRVKVALIYEDVVWAIWSQRVVSQTKSRSQQR